MPMTPRAFSIIPFLAVLPLQGAQFETVDVFTEILSSSDIVVLSANVSSEVTLGEFWSLDFSVEGMQNAITYQPNAAIDPFGEEVDLEEELIGLNLGLEYSSGAWQLTLSANAYDGFRSASAIWLNEYYRQQYGAGGVPGVAYETPEPDGRGFTLAARYELLPASAYLTVSAGYLRETVAPGYEIGDLGTAFELVRGEEVLDSWFGSVEFEALLSRKARMQQSLSIADTTDRELRTSWRGALNYALSDRWISRTQASFTHEDPGFEAWSIAQTFEYTLNDHWALSVTARYYEDTGQIESANLISSAAPALETEQLYLTLRRSAIDGESGFALSVGPYSSDYGATGIGTERFSRLYRDRDWWWGRLAYRHLF
jgi:hypothetical protein